MDRGRVDRIIRRKAGPTTKKTSVIFKPDQFGIVELWQYIQELQYDGSVVLLYEEYREHIAELVTHKEILEKYSAAHLKQKDKDIQQEDSLEEPSHLTEEEQRGIPCVHLS